MIERPKEPAQRNGVNLMDALRAERRQTRKRHRHRVSRFVDLLKIVGEFSRKPRLFGMLHLQADAQLRTRFCPNRDKMRSDFVASR
jgi:hypothetical protein